MYLFPIFIFHNGRVLWKVNKHTNLKKIKEVDIRFIKHCGSWTNKLRELLSSERNTVLI